MYILYMYYQFYYKISHFSTRDFFSPVEVKWREVLLLRKFTLFCGDSFIFVNLYINTIGIFIDLSNNVHSIRLDDSDLYVSKTLEAPQFCYNSLTMN